VGGGKREDPRQRSNVNDLKAVSTADSGFPEEPPDLTKQPVHALDCESAVVNDDVLT